MSERAVPLDLFDEKVGASVDEINELATSDDHGWEAVDPDPFGRNEHAAVKLAVSFESADAQAEFCARWPKYANDLDEDLVAPQQGALDLGVVETVELEVVKPLEWKDLPWFAQPERRRTLTIGFDSEAKRREFLADAGITTVHKGTRGTLSVWWPDRAKEDLSSLRFVSTGLTKPRYPVYVISKGRASPTQALTARFLERDGVPFTLAVEPQEYEAYRRAFPRAKIVALPFSNLGKGSYPARNWCWETALLSGYDRHWILDDNIGQVRRLYAGKRIPCDAGPALAAVEEFAGRYENVAIAGLNYQMFVTPTSPPYATNVHVYSALLIQNDLPYRWRLKYNEDTDLCLQALASGAATVLVSAFMIDKKTTMTMKGGNADELYKGDGRTVMANTLASHWPEFVSVSHRFGRDQHVVAWDVFRTPLAKCWDAAAGSGEAGIDLVKIREPDSPALRKLYDEYHLRKEHDRGRAA